MKSILIRTQEETSESKLHPIIKFLCLPELFVTIFVIIIYVFVTQFVTEVNPLYVPENDSLSSYPFPNHNTFPIRILCVYSLGTPIAFSIVCFLVSLKFPTIMKKMYICAAFYLILTNFLCVSMITEILKNYVGRARPDMYERCGKNAQYNTCQGLNGHDLKDSFKSFPSGHSSTAMSGMYLAALILKSGTTIKNISIAVIELLCILFAFYIGASRIRDFRHHPDDVVAGLFIGFVVTHIIWGASKRSVYPKENIVLNDNETAPSGTEDISSNV
ncbi:PAP2 superfamily protein [Tritrichomonas foetus]|uniref:PAP2 superfamily protein n=1 Tax=Tritrichomonas foetus TaxID=1144522 RepID=A0A1J4KR96_9EUKA|nr:PAP2 superfamily protein [Tritrichomonas foetus]|eukprot:OHT11997.1 PAP2 superfamily protein [Tritrichomonas foetus]